jgi:type I restriction enzyme R subunit
MLVAGSIYEACKFYEIFARTELKGKCAIVTSYSPTVADAKGETTGAGETDNLFKYASPDARRLVRRAGGHRQQQGGEVRAGGEEAIRRAAGADEAPDRGGPAPHRLRCAAGHVPLHRKPMRDHGLFQAICRVNRLDGEDKEYGTIIDYKDLFKPLEGAVADYTSDAFDAYDKEDVNGLLQNRLEKAREDLEEAREAVKALSEPVEQPKDSAAYLLLRPGLGQRRTAQGQ